MDRGGPNGHRAFERPAQRAFEINWRKAGGPVFGVGPIWLSRLARRADRRAAIDGFELDPALPKSVGHRGSSRAGPVQPAVRRLDQRAEFQEYFGHGALRQPALQLRRRNRLTILS